MSSAFSIDYLEPTSEFQTPKTLLLVDKTQSVGIHFLRVARKILVIKLSGFAEIFTFSTPAPMVSVLADIANNATSSLISSSEARKFIFHPWRMHFSFHSMKLMAYSFQKFEYPM